jgi:hypothetical protein
MEKPRVQVMINSGKLLYKLVHYYEYGKNGEFDELKSLGIYSSRQKAEEAIQRYIRLPGFCNYPIECFLIGESTVDVDDE